MATRGRKVTKEMGKIGKMTDDWINASYPKSSHQSIWKFRNRLNLFLEYAGLTDAELIESYKRSKDRQEWAKQIGLKVVDYYKDRVSKGYSTNTVRTEVSTVRAFCRDNATTLIIQRRKIAKAKSAMGEHEFTREELAKMFYVADVRGKAILSVGVSLGFSIQDFAELKRDQIEGLVNKALNEKIDFIGFDYERGKTGVESRSHLTPEAINSLKTWFEYIDAKRTEKGLTKSEYVWANGNGNFLNEQTLNDILKDLVKKANISVTGKLKFHLLRKFLMSALHDSGFDSWETKRALGKEIPTSDDTYLKSLSRKVTEKFPKAYEYIRLTGFANHNQTRLEDLESKIQRIEIKMESMNLENLTLKRIIDFAIPPETIKKALIDTARRLPNMTEDKVQQLENILKNARTMEEMQSGLVNITGSVKGEKKCE